MSLPALSMDRIPPQLQSLGISCQQNGDAIDVFMANFHSRINRINGGIILTAWWLPAMSITDTQALRQAINRMNLRDHGLKFVLDRQPQGGLVAISGSYLLESGATDEQLRTIADYFYSRCHFLVDELAEEFPQARAARDAK